MSLATLFLIIALILFVAGSLGLTARVNLVAAGLACCVLSVLVPAIS